MKFLTELAAKYQAEDFEAQADHTDHRRQFYSLNAGERAKQKQLKNNNE